MILLSRKKNLYVDAEEQSLQVSEVELHLILFYLLFVFFMVLICSFFMFVGTTAKMYLYNLLSSVRLYQ